MPILLKNVLKHELIGLKAKVTKSQNPSLIGVEGTIIDETKNTLVILENDVKKIVPKEVAVLRLELTDGTLIEVDGKEIVGRSEERLKKRIRRW
jgi:ribonuclease P protein subunit POP4